MGDEPRKDSPMDAAMALLTQLTKRIVHQAECLEVFAEREERREQRERRR